MAGGPGTGGSEVRSGSVPGGAGGRVPVSAMPKDYSPFSPGQPVPAEFFVGRVPEIERLQGSAEAAADGRLRVAFLDGERGIGKSSLASIVRSVSERDLRVLGIHSFLGGVSSLEEMARRVFDRLLKESIGQVWHEQVRTFFGDHVERVGLFGLSLEFAAPQRDLTRVVHDFAPALRNLLAALRGQRGGLLLVLDDINGLAGSVAFANWLKSLVDEIATAREPLPLFLLLVGLPERRRSLVALQPSLARVFDLVEIQPWPDSETRDFFVSAFSKVRVAVDPDALDVLVRYAGGLPVLAHEIGDAVYKTDQDERVDLQDAWDGIFAAADVVGRKHLEPGVLQAIRSERYLAILRKIGDTALPVSSLTGPFDVRFRRSELLARLRDDERRVLDSFLRRMRELNVIAPEPDAGRGAYRFDNRLHHLYLWIETQRTRRRRQEPRPARERHP